MEMMTIVTQLEYDLKELDMLSSASENKPSYAYEIEPYVKAQTSMVEEFSKFLDEEIKFADEIQLKL